MPVSADAMLSAGMAGNLDIIRAGKFITHTVATGGTKLAFLGDVMYLPKPYPRPKVFSIGDIFLAVGIFIYIQQIMVKRFSKHKHKI